MTPTSPQFDPMQCLTCGRPHARCSAHTRAGDPCGNYPMYDQRICRMHGGKAKQNLVAAERRSVIRAVEADAHAVLAFEGLSGIDNPLEELAKVARESMAFKDALAARINALSKLRGAANSAGTEQLKVEVGLYERAMDRTGKFLDLLVRSGFEEKRVRLAQAQGAILAGTIRQVLNMMEAAMLEMYGNDQFAKDRLRGAWPAAVSEIVPGVLRSVIEDGE
jgi:hypothetical protein